MGSEQQDPHLDPGLESLADEHQAGMGRHKCHMWEWVMIAQRKDLSFRETWKYLGLQIPYLEKNNHAESSFIPKLLFDPVQTREAGRGSIVGL